MIERVQHKLGRIQRERCGIHTAHLSTICWYVETAKSSSTAVGGDDDARRVKDRTRCGDRDVFHGRSRLIAGYGRTFRPFDGGAQNLCTREKLDKQPGVRSILIAATLEAEAEAIEG